MAKGRLIWKTLGSSKRFARLARELNGLGEFAQVLYPLLVTHADDVGREEGDAFTVKTRVFPSSPRTEAEFDEALTAMQRVRLIDRYEVDGQQVIQIVDYKQDLRRIDPSHFPAPAGVSARTERTAAIHDVRAAEEKGREENRSEGKRTERTPLARRGLEGFEEFWTLFPKKRSRSDAERAWLKLAPDSGLCQRILDAVAAQTQWPDWRKEHGKYIPYPATWLNGQRWLDEPAPLLRASAAPAEVDWFDECQRLHQRTCNGRYAHGLRMLREQGEAS